MNHEEFVKLWVEHTPQLSEAERQEAIQQARESDALEMRIRNLFYYAINNQFKE